MSALTLTTRRPIYGSGSKTAYSDTAGSAKVPPDSNAVIVCCSTDAFVAVGKTATTTDLFLPAYIVAIIPIGKKDGSPIEVSAIRDSSDGYLYCSGTSE